MSQKFRDGRVLLYGKLLQIILINIKSRRKGRCMVKSCRWPQHFFSIKLIFGNPKKQKCQIN